MTEATELKTIFLINRETGQFMLQYRFFSLDFETNTLFTIEDEARYPIGKGSQTDNIWRFNCLGYTGEDKDPFAAVFRALFQALDSETGVQ